MRSSLSSIELDAMAGSNDSAQALSQEWKQEANRRLAAHRARRSGRGLQAALPGMEDVAVVSPASRGKSVADRVAARYAKAPTYSEMLAAEARNAVRAAAAASVAAGEARDAAQAILEGLDVDLNEGLDREAYSREKRQTWGPSCNDPLPSARYPSSSAITDDQVTEMGSAAVPSILEASDDEPLHPIHALPAKLLEFPRELIAARKARPRLAEGPLREESGRDSLSQLRIFEVETEAISTNPVLDPVLPGWDSDGELVSRSFGDQWLTKARSAVLIVPSKVTGGVETNLLINPLHPDFDKIRAGEPKTVLWDSRFFQ